MRCGRCNSPSLRIRDGNHPTGRVADVDRTSYRFTRLQFHVGQFQHRSGHGRQRGIEGQHHRAIHVGLRLELGALGSPGVGHLHALLLLRSQVASRFRPRLFAHQINAAFRIERHLGRFERRHRINLPGRKDRPGHLRRRIGLDWPWRRVWLRQISWHGLRSRHGYWYLHLGVRDGRLG